MRQRLLKLKVRPESRESSISERGPDAYEARVRAPAERGLANREALSLLAGVLAIEPKRLRIIKGATSPAKIVAVLG